MFTKKPLLQNDNMSLLLPEFSQLHHAYVFVGDTENLQKQLFQYSEQQTDEIVFQKHAYETFKIEDAHTLKKIQQQKTHQPIFFVLSLQGITHEAQNALLKVLEEPTHHVYFFFLVHDKNIFIPTVLSRVHVLETNVKTKQHKIDILSFLALRKSERIEIIKKQVESKENPFTKQEAILFLDELEMVLYEKKYMHTEFFSTISLVRDYLYNRGSSLKMLLEYLSLSLPQLDSWE